MKMLRKEPGDRSVLPELLKHEWFTSNFEEDQEAKTGSDTDAN